jgi:hypothetical protein
LVVRTQKEKNGSGLYSFLDLRALQKFISYLSSKPVFALPSFPSLYPALVADLSFRRELLPQAESSSKSDL